MSRLPLALALALAVPLCAVGQAANIGDGGGSGGGINAGERYYRSLDAYAHTRSGDVEWAIRDADGKLHQSPNGSKVRIRCASIVKAIILSALIQKAADERRPLTTREQDIASKMIIYSDNNSATALWNQLHCIPRETMGWTPERTCRRDYFVDFMRKVGMRHTVENPAWGYTETTAGDMTLLMSQLFAHKIATPALCRYALGLMTRITPSESWGLKDGLPTGTWIAFKNGWYPESTVWRVNTIGAIRTRSGPYFMSVLTRYDVRHGMGYGIDTIRELSRRAWRLETQKLKKLKHTELAGEYTSVP